MVQEHTKKNLIGLLHQVAFPLKSYLAYNNADCIWNNRNMNPVPAQSYADRKYIHKQTLPPQFFKTPAESHFYN